jgi:hypothetical protein
MGENTLRYHPRESVNTYWRRRFLVLVSCLAVLAFAAWGISQALRIIPASGASSSSGNGRQGPAGGGTPGSNHGGTGPGSGHHPGSPSKGTGSTPASTSSGQPGHTLQPSPSPSHSGSPSPSASRRKSGSGKPAACAQGAVVLTLSATQLTFGTRQTPAFSLAVVSTQKATCSFNIGSAHLAVVVMEGKTRIWSSADCPTGVRSQVTELKRGVPTVVTVTWDKRTSAPGCSGQARRARRGEYSAYAVQRSITSALTTFRLD